MKATAATLGQALLLLVLGLVVGLGVNAVREKQHIYLRQNYVPDVPRVPRDPNTGVPQPPGEPNIPYETVSVDEAATILGYPDTKLGLYVFVDARNDDMFEAGHIPGAVQCDPYGPPTMIDNVAGRVAGAAKVIVYCHGGSCEDSVLLCNYLVERGVPKETLYVFKGGWDEWTAGKHPVTTGRE